MMPTGSAVSDRSISERRYLTIVFADLVGYTELSQQLDPEDLWGVQSRYQQLATTVMEGYGGFVARFSGDGILIYFGYPIAHENDAERAVRAALELVERLPGLDLGVAAHPVRQLAVRIGVHTGLVVMGRETMSAGAVEHGVFGEAVNLAARLQAEAPANSVVVSAQTIDLVEGLFESESLGPRQIKGIADPITPHHVRRALPGTSRIRSHLERGATPMIGRLTAMDRIVSHWETTRRESCCQTVVVVGEAGVGKSRLVMELCGRPEFASANVLQTNCHEIFASTPLYPVGSFLWTRCGLTVDDDEFARIRKISAVLDELGLNGAENVEIFASLLGLAVTGVTDVIAPTPVLFKRKQFAFIIRVIAQLARRQPTLLWIEDAHWLDPSSAELLRELVGELADAPILALLTTRSFPKGPALPPAVDAIRLEPLGVAECFDLARSVPGAQILSDAALSRAVDAAGGIPLFVEQLVLGLIDEHTKVPVSGRRNPGLPLTLAEMMSERLDRLPGGRRVVQAAACIGRSFTPEFLGALMQEDVIRVAVPLEALVDAEILRPMRPGAEERYEFCHGLLQRTAYESMVQGERRAMHARIVQVLKRYQDLRLMVPEMMAHHLTEAGEFDDAITAWLESGRSAARRSAHVEAIEHIRRGLGLLDRVVEPELRRKRELSLQAALIGSITATQGSTSRELSACCERGLRLCEQGGPNPLIFPFLFGKFTFALCTGRVHEAGSFAELFLSLAERDAYGPGRVIGHRLVGRVLLSQGRAAEARHELERSLRLYSPERDGPVTHMFGQNTQVHSAALLSLALFCLGEVDEALRVGLDTLRAADDLRHPHSTALALSYVGGLVLGLCGATEGLMREARRLVAVCEQHRLEPFRLFGRAFMGCALCLHGDLRQGIDLMEEALRELHRLDFQIGTALQMVNLADAMRRFGRLEPAEALCTRALQMVCGGCDQWIEPEVRRVAALIAGERRQDEPGAVEAMFRDAVACARRLGFPVFERRCLLSLRDHLGPAREDRDIDARIEGLASFADLDRRAAKAVAARSAQVDAIAGTGVIG